MALFSKICYYHNSEYDIKYIDIIWGYGLRGENALPIFFYPIIVYSGYRVTEG